LASFFNTKYWCVSVRMRLTMTSPATAANAARAMKVLRQPQAWERAPPKTGPRTCGVRPWVDWQAERRQQGGVKK
jgi:hypothetical protein